VKTLSTFGQAAIASGACGLVVLVSMAFSPTALNLCTGGINLVAGGITYTATAGLGKISPVTTTASEVKQLQFDFSGVPAANLALVLGTPVQGVPVTVSLAVIDPSTNTVTDVVPLWVGVLDTMNLDDAPATATISVTAEHVGIDLNRPAPLYYADGDQQTLHPGDLFFQYTSQQFDQQIVWPNANYYRR